MKKVGIITINDFNNYGNRVQCYAVQELLRKNGVECENIYNTGLSKKQRIKKYTLKFIKFVLNRGNERNLYKRSKVFKKFNNNIIFSKYKVKNGKYSARLNEEYDLFIVGSDQVWNPDFLTTSDADFLTFADNSKKIAFSASFGVNKLPEAKKDYYKKKLEVFKFISVREEAGKKIIDDLGIKNDVKVLVDPTMLLPEDNWNKVMNKPAQYNGEKYILTYFIGNLSDERKSEIERIATKNKWKIINLLDKNDPFYISGPGEFLWLEKHAELICTDSFHSSVFAILFGKPFIVFSREDSYASMNSRLDTLLSKFNLESRKYNGGISEDMLDCNYDEAKKILEEERKRAYSFLEGTLRGK